MATFGQVLREIRTERGLTQGQLAYKAHTSPEYISMLENNPERMPTTGLLVRLTTALHTTPDYVLHRAGMLKTNSHTPLEPEVQRIADLLAAWPESDVKGNMRAIITTVGETMEHLLRALNDDALKETTNEDGGSAVS